MRIGLLSGAISGLIRFLHAAMFTPSITEGSADVALMAIAHMLGGIGQLVLFVTVLVFTAYTAEQAKDVPEPPKPDLFRRGPARGMQSDDLYVKWTTYLNMRDDRRRNLDREIDGGEE